MAEDLTPPSLPPSAPLPPPAPRASPVWWFVWVFATVIAPGLAVPIGNALQTTNVPQAVLLSLGGIILVLHLVSSITLGRERSGCIAVALLFGGWALILATFFVGCVTVINKTNFH